MKSFILFFSLMIILFSSCGNQFHTKTYNLNQDIISNDLVINFAENTIIEKLVLKLKDEQNCKINLDLYYSKNDILTFKETISIKNGLDKLNIDWYENNVHVKVSGQSKIVCEYLEVDVIASYIELEN